MQTDIDTFNKFMVGSQNRGRLRIMNNLACRGEITADEALLLAAYLVAMAEQDANHSFTQVLEAVRNA